MQSSSLLGELVVVALKAENLQRQTTREQDPFCVFRVNEIMKRTKTDYGGGSYPIWDDQVNIPISHGPYQMRVQVFNKDMNPNHLMGEAVIDLAKVMREKEHDGYFPLMCRGQPSGEIYLELTFYLAKHAIASAQQPVRYQYPPNYQRPGPSIPQQLHRPPPPVPYQKPLPPRPNLTASYSAPSHYALPTHRPAPYSMPPPSLSAPPLHILPSNPSAPHSLPMSPHYPMPPPLPQSMPMPHPRPLSPPQIFMSPTAPFLSPAVSRPQAMSQDSLPQGNYPPAYPHQGPPSSRPYPPGIRPMPYPPY